MFEKLTLPIRALMAAHAFGVSREYARKVLALMDELEQGKINIMEFFRRGDHLGEMYPDDHRHAREQLGLGQKKGDL